jgi:hypothetical protein
METDPMSGAIDFPNRFDKLLGAVTMFAIIGNLASRDYDRQNRFFLVMIVAGVPFMRKALRYEASLPELTNPTSHDTIQA